MRSSWARAVAFILLATAITGLWMFVAKTETYENNYNSIVKNADGSAPVPFVKRRLLPDMSRLIADMVPTAAWEMARDTLTSDALLMRPVRTFLTQQKWRPEDYPLLLSATFLIWLSVLAFLYTIRALIHHLYETTPGLADAVSAALGLALLGGAGWSYQSYPYDMPMCFLFTLTFLGMIARRWWFLLPFAAACYCKETSVLLVPAYFLLWGDWRSWRSLSVGVLLGTIYLAVRWIIDSQYPSPPGQFWGAFWYPGRNAHALAGGAIFYCWTFPFVAVCAYRMLRLWPEYPLPLRRLLWLPVPMIAIALVRGIIEEKRQYLELLSVVGLLTAHWALYEFGLGEKFYTRVASQNPAPPVPPLAA